MHRDNDNKKYKVRGALNGANYDAHRHFLDLGLTAAARQQLAAAALETGRDLDVQMDDDLSALNNIPNDDDWVDEDELDDGEALNNTRRDIVITYVLYYLLSISSDRYAVSTLLAVTFVVTNELGETGIVWPIPNGRHNSRHW